jgi:hypothetical protein
MKSMIFCAAAAVVALVASAAWADECSIYKTSERNSTDPAQILLMIDAKAAVKAKMDDKHLAFRNIYFCKTPRDQIPMACGEVKSARTGKGYVKFLSGGRAEMTSWQGDGKDGFDSAWTRFCQP